MLHFSNHSIGEWPSRGVAISGAVLAGTALVWTGLFLSASVYAQGRGPAPVLVAAVVEQTVSPTQEFVGTVGPERRAIVGSAVDGRVNEYLISEGERVEEGQPLARLLDETISQEIAAAEAELVFFEQELAELQRGSLPEEKQQAAAMLSVAEARQELARRNYERTRTLFMNSGASSENELDEARASLDETTAIVLDRIAAKKLVDDGPRVEKILQAQARRSMQEAIVQKLKDQKKKHTMISRFAGYVAVERTEVGEWVNRGDAVAEIVALDHVDVMVYVLESYIPFVHLGQEVAVQIPALKKVGQIDAPFLGKVVHILPEADQRSRTFPVKVRVQNLFHQKEPIIKSGMIGRVSLPVGPQTQSRLIPKDALVLGGQTPVVWVLDLAEGEINKGTVRPVPVKTGVTSGTMIAIGDELQVGQLVITEGNERLRPGAEVLILEK